MMRCTLTVIFGYLLIGFMTFAYVQEFKEGRPDDPRYSPQLNKWERDNDRNMESAIGGIFWPIYWAGRGSLAVVHSAHVTLAPQKPMCSDGTTTWEPEQGICRVSR